MQKQKSRKAEPPFTPKLKTLVSVIAYILASNQALANGVEPEVIAGDVSFSAQGNLLNVTNSPGAIIHWQGFSIGAGDTTHFQQQSAISSVLNRVTGSDPSSILGTLSSNGRVFLINPSGILFGQDARVDVAGLVASTLNISNQDFRAGLLNFTADPLAGNVDSRGSITTPSGGSVYLVGTDVSNSGLINSPQGDVILAAGATVKIFDTSTPGVRVELTADANAVTNLGEILAHSGDVGIYGAALRNSGSINADQVVRDANGRIVLRASSNVTLTIDSQLSASGEQGGAVSVQADTGTLLVDGSIDVSSTAGTGGSIALLGERVGLLDATIDASGSAGGGTVLVGGDYQGSNAQVQNAASTYVGPGATIKADALTQGDGGKVIVWADDFTRYAGNISARGGDGIGDGGTVETSGKQNLEVLGGSVDTRAPQGLPGTWLLDPSNVNITTGTTTGTFAGEIFAPNQDTAIVNAGTIATALITGNVNITTTNAAGAQAGTITVSAPITRASGTGTTTLTLTPSQVTGGTITIAAGAAISGTSGSPLSLTLAGAGVGATVAVGAPVTTFGGNFSSTGTTFTNLAGAIDTSGSGASNGGSITLNHSTTMTIAAPLISGGGNISIAGGSTFTDTSTINAGTGTVTLRGSTDTLAIGIGSTTGTFNITQAQIANITTTGGLFFGHSAGTGAIHIGTNEAVDFGAKNVTVLQASGGMTIEGSTVNGTGALTFNAGTGFFLNNSQILSTGAISLIADQVTLNANISGSTLAIAPFTASMAIKVGEAATRIDFGGTNFNTASLTSNSLRPLKIGNTANTGGLTVTGAFNTGSPVLELLTGGVLTINAGGTVNAGRIVLAGSNFINNGGAAALVVPGTSYWLVYSTDPALNTFGGMASGSLALWGKTYAANPPATITDLTSHYIFSKVPRLTVSVSGGNLTKTYGTNLTGSAPSVVVAGLVNATTYGNVFLQDAYTGTAAAASAGFAVTAAVNGGTPYVISAADNITAPTGYGTTIFDNTQLTVTPYVVSLSGTRVYDGSVNILAGVLGTNTLVGTETLSLSGTGTVASKNVGAGKTLTLGSLALGNGTNGGLASNYTVTGGTHTAGITAAALTLSTSAVSKTYDGNLSALGTAVVNSGTLFTGDTLSGGTFAFTDKNVGAGNKTVTAAGVTVSDGNSGSNYTVSYASNTTSTISPYVVNLSGTRVYDGSANILAAMLGTNALVGTETLSLTGTGTVANKNVGAGKSLTLGSLALGNGTNGGLASNYTVTGGTHAAGITAAALTLSTSAVSKTYDGNLTALGTAVVNSGTLFTGDTLSGGTFAFTDKNVGAGNKTVTAAGVTVNDGNSGGNYTVSYASNTASTINHYVVNLSGTRVYDGSVDILAGILGTNALVGTETLSLSGTSTVASKNVGANKPLTLGSLVLADGTNGGLATNYTVTGGTHTASVSAATLTLSTNAVSKTYDGNLTALGTAVVNSGSLFSGDTISGGTFAFTDKNVGAGNKTVTAAGVTVSDGNGGSNYTVSYASNTASTINPFVVSLSGTRTYDGSVNILAGTLGTGTLAGTETLSLTGIGTVASKNIGTGKALTLGSLALGNGTNGGLATNYTVTGGTHTAGITAAPLTLSTSAVSKTYDGNLSALGTAVVSSGTLFTGDTLSGGAFAFTDKNAGAGNKTVTAAGVTVSDGNGGSNYTVSYASNTASTINPYVVSLSGTRVYDGSVNILAGVLGTNVLVGTETLSLTGIGTVANKNVGAGKALTLGSLALGNGTNGGLATNYTVTGGTHTASVTAAALTLSTSAVSKTYDANLAALGTAVISSGTLFTGDTLSGGTFAFTDKNVGSGNKTVTAAGVTVSDGNSGSNYTVSYASNTASTINPFVVSLSGTRTYDGSVNILAGALGTGTLAGTETLSLTGTGTVVSKNVGSGKTLTLGSLALGNGTNGGLATNYTVTGGTHTAGVTAAPLTLSTSAVSKTYDGNLIALGTALVSSGTLFTGDTLSGGTFAFTDKNVGSGNKTVTAAGVTVSDGNGGSNYTVSYASNTASTINPYVVSLSGTRIYDGSANILAAMLGTNALVGTETLSLTGTGTVASKNVGTGKTLTLGSLALGNGTNGGLATNYTVTGGTYTASVTAAALTLSTSAVSKTYDGNLSALGTAAVSSGTLFTGDTLSGGTFAFTDKNVGAGNKTVTASGVTVNDGNSGSNYTVAYASNTASTINPYVVNVSGTRIYDGSVNILAGMLGTSTLVGTETLNLTGTGTVTNKNVGAGKLLTLGSLALGNGTNGGLATNYTVTGGTHTAGITAAALTLSTSAVSKTYDGNLTALGAAVVSSGTLFSGDAISGGTFAFTDKNVGSGNKTVTAAGVTVTDGNGGGNYTVGYAPNTASTINPYIVNLSGTRVYDGSVNILAGALRTNALVGTETLTLSGTGTVTSKDVSTSKPLTLGTLALGNGTNGGLATNYTLSGGTRSVSITQALLSIAANAGVKVYDGLAWSAGNGVTYTGFKGSDTAADLTGTLVYGGNSQGATNVGNYNLVPSGQSSANYATTYVNGNLGITRAPLGIVANSGSKVYGSTLSFTGSEFSSTGLKNAETIGSVNLTSLGASATATVAGSPYDIIASAATGGTFNPANYTISYVDGSLGLTAAELGIAATAAIKVYDGLAWSGGNGVTYTGFQGADTAATLTGTLVYGGNAQGATNAGTYNIAPSGQTSTNYTITYVNGSLGITRAPLGIAADSSSKTYGSTPVFIGDEFTSTGLKNAETIGNVSLTSTGTAANAGVAGGPYAIVASGASGGTFNPANYTIDYVDGSLGITAAELGITANAAVKVYDGLAWSGGNGVTYSGFQGTDTAASLTGALVYGGSSQGATNAGNYGIAPSGQTSANYTITYVNGSLGITPATLGIAANSSSKTYGTALLFNGTEFSSTGLQNAETIGSVSLTSLGAGSSATVEDSPYAIVASGATGGSFNPANYTISYVDGTLGVIRAGLLGIAANSAVKVYNGLAWSGGNGVTYTGFLGGDTAADLTGTLSYGGTSQGAINAGNYTIIPSGQSSTNYTITYVNGSLSVTRAPLGIVANSSSKIYGSTPVLAGTSFTSTGLKNLETIGSVTLTSAGVAATAGVAGGPYAIVPSAATGGTFTAANYTITYVNGSLGVTPAALGITAKAAIKVYDGLPWSGGNGVIYTGLRGGDTAASLTGLLTYGGSAQGATNAGNYGIVPSGLSSSNYTISYVNGSLGVTRAPLGIVANSSSKTYGTTRLFTGSEFSSTGLKNAQTIGSVSLSSGGALASAGVAGGPYAIVASAASGGTFNPANYTISYVNGSLGVTPAALGIAANAAVKGYDGLAWSGGNGVTYTGLRGTDTAANLSGTLTYGGTSQGAINAGNYSLRPSGLSSANYTITYVNGSLGITRAPLGIVANSISKNYGSTLTFAGTEFTSTGLKNAETIGAVTLASAGTTATADVAGSPYAIVASAANGGTFNAANYSISYVDGNLGVIPVGLLGVVANSAAKVYDGLAWSGGNGVVYSGFQGTDSAADLIGTLLYGGTSQGATDVGNYTIVPSGQSATNYTLSYVNGTLGITPAALGIVANSASKSFGTEHTFTGTEFSSTGLKGVETIGSVTLTSPGSTASASVADGSYAIVPTAAKGGTFNPDNYTISYTNGTLAVTPAGLLGIVANPATRVYDGLAWTGGNGVTYSGFQGSDTAASLNGTLTYGGTSQGAIAVGNYTIVPSGQSSMNYTVSYVNGTLGITPAALGIVANSASKSFGTEHTFTGAEFTSTGLKGVETIGSVTLTSPGSAASATVAAGPYAIVPSAATGGAFNPANYTISYTTGTLAVTPAGLLGIVANPASKIYDGLAWSGGNGVSYSGFQGTDTAASLNGTLTYGGTSQGAIDVGSYTIIPAGQSSPNYTITYVNSILGITPAPLAVLANSNSKVYGSALGFSGTEFTSSGLRGAETIGAVSLSSAGAAAAANVGGGPYTIVPNAARGGSFKPSNYAISYVDGSLRVTPAALMVVADSHSKTFGTPDPQLSFRVTGLLNNAALGLNDTTGSVLTGSLARRAGETVSGGPYAINSGTLAANSNYTMGFTPATLGITAVVVEEIADFNAGPVIFAGLIHNVFFYRPGNFWHISLNSNDADQGFDVMRGTGTAETRLRRSLNRCDSVSGSGFCETWTFPQQQDNDQ